MSGFNFGIAQTSQPNVSFNFATKTSVANTGTGFGASLTNVSAPATVTGFGQSNLFSTTTTTASLPTFGSTSVPSFGMNSFSFNPQTAVTSGTSFNPSANSFGTSGSSSVFNKPMSFNTTGTNLFQNQQQQQQQQQQQLIQQQANSQITPLTCLLEPKIFNDERDTIIGLFNRIQAFWGFGKAYYSAFNPPFEFSETDCFNRFKTICFSEISIDEKNKEEKLFFLIKYAGEESQLKTMILTYEQNFKQLIGNNFNVKLELTTILPDFKALISIHITENATGKEISDSQLRNYFNQPQWKQQLNQIFAGNFIEVVFSSLSKQEIAAYLSVPPKGIDERLWEQAKLENPDPERFIPLPLIGFEALNNRFKLQEKEIHLQQSRLKQMVDNVTALESDILQFKAKYEECRRKHDNLSYQVLKKMIAQEVRRKRNLPIQAEEDKLRASLEAIQSELNVPTKFQGCLNELMSQLRQMQSQNHVANKITLDKNILCEYQQLLKEENKGIMNLVEILKKDIEDINKLSDAIKKT